MLVEFIHEFEHRASHRSLCGRYGVILQERQGAGRILVYIRLSILNKLFLKFKEVKTWI